MIKDLIRKRLLTAVFAALGGLAVTALHEKLNLPLEAAQELVNQLLTVIGVYILGQSASDVAAVIKGTKAN